MRVACAFQTAQPFRLCGDGLDVCLTDALLRRGGTHHRAEPAQGGGTPVGPPRRADSVPQQERLQPQLRRLQIPEGLCPRPTQGADRCLVEGRALDRGRSPARMSRASGLASRRSVWTRAPTFLGMKAGATTQQPSSF